MQLNPLPNQSVYKTRTARDLCETCAHMETCSLREMPTAPVHQCEEYDDGSRTAVLTEVRADKAPRTAPVAVGVGLCVNCEHRATCTLPRPASGVWNCEEYR